MDYTQNAFKNADHKGTNKEIEDTLQKADIVKFVKSLRLR
jgi:hypothetical protein